MADTAAAAVLAQEGFHERARIVAHHCIHPSRARSGLRMTRTAPVDPLSHSVGFRVKPLFVTWTISMDSIVPTVFAIGAE